MNLTERLLFTLQTSVELLEEIDGVKYLPYRMLWGRSLQGYPKNSVQKALKRSINRGLIERRLSNQQVYLALTELGEKLYQKKTKGNLKLTKSQERWDKLYRLIFFDIPEQDRLIRDNLRRQLKKVGAVGWQKSLWVTKVNITQDLNNFITENGLEKNVLVVEVRELYNPELKKILDEV